MVRALTKMAIHHLGYDVRRMASPKTVHVAEAGSDPITFEYRPDCRGYAMFDVSLEDVRGFRSLALPLRSDCHPFVRAVKCALSEERDEAVGAAIEKVLRTYYRTVRPASAPEVLGLSWNDLPSLRGVAPDSDGHAVDIGMMPWSAKSLAEIREGRHRAATFEGLQNGVLTGFQDGATGFGPVKPAKLSLEVRRLANLVASVKSRGFIAFDPRGPLKVGAFRRDGQYKWLINHGQHRFATAAAFGIKSVPAMVTEVIRFDDARYWPQVVNGMFTEAAAKSIFERIFDGTPAPVCNAWIQSTTCGEPDVRD